MGNAENLGGNTKIAGSKGGDAGNEGRILDIAVEITWKSNGNDKFKEWREIKIIENEHIYKNLILQVLQIFQIWCLSC